jgi:hypothetical protein
MLDKYEQRRLGLACCRIQRYFNQAYCLNHREPFRTILLAQEMPISATEFRSPHVPCPFVVINSVSASASIHVSTQITSFNLQWRAHIQVVLTGNNTCSFHDIPSGIAAVNFNNPNRRKQACSVWRWLYMASEYLLDRSV